MSSEILDLKLLAQQLRDEEPSEPHFNEELNPYLLHTVLPMLEQGNATLDKIDLNQFDTEDPFTILNYYQWQENLRNDLLRINDRLCDLPPASVKVRAFL